MARPAYFAELSCAGILAAVLWGPASAAALTGWLLLLAAVTLARLALHRAFAPASGVVWALPFLGVATGFLDESDQACWLAALAGLLFGVLMARIHLNMHRSIGKNLDAQRHNDELAQRLAAAEDRLKDPPLVAKAAEPAVSTPEAAPRASETMYRNLVETSSDLIWSLDSQGRWTYLNAAAARRIYGREPADMLGRAQSEVVARELRERDGAVLRRVLAGEAVFAHETRHLHADGTPIDLAFNAIAVRDGQGRIVGTSGTAQDITERKRAAAALHESVEKLRLAVRAAELGYWEWEAGRDAPQSDPMVHPDDKEHCARAWNDAVARGETYEAEYRVFTAGGELRWFSSRGVPVLDASGRTHRMIGVSQDISERKRNEETARDLAYHDVLTGLPNRRLLDDRLRQALYAAQRRERMVAAMLIGLDEFKRVNDSHGHRAGDAVLREVAHRLAGCVRKADTVARQGGDEFVVVLSDLHGRADCERVAEKLLHALEQDFRIDGDALRIGASIGISVYPEEATDGNALLRNADAAMYRAKQLGRNRYSFFGR